MAIPLNWQRMCSHHIGNGPNESPQRPCELSSITLELSDASGKVGGLFLLRRHLQALFLEHPWVAFISITVKPIVESSL